MRQRETTPRITVLSVPDCPNAPIVVERIRAALGEPAAPVELIAISQEAEAARLGMTGSPTVLLDGVDPFAVPDARPSVSCRLYRHADGTTDGVPSLVELRHALTRPADLLGAVGRAGRGRRAPAAGGLRVVQQAVLRHFATTGTPPAPHALDPLAAPFGRTGLEVLAELAREDFLTLDDHGHIRAAYPFSADPTRHRVRIDGGAQAWSMCAIDALGIPAMLRRDVTISSTDPTNGRPVTVTTTGGTFGWEPAEAVVLLGRRARAGPAAAVCCDVLNFFTHAASARAWDARHPDVRAEIVDQTRAAEIGRRVFGPLLDDDAA